MTVPSLEDSMLKLTTMSFLLDTIINLIEANQFWAIKTQTGAGQSNPGDCKFHVFKVTHLAHSVKTNLTGFLSNNIAYPIGKIGCSFEWHCLFWAITFPKRGKTSLADREFSVFRRPK